MILENQGRDLANLVLCLEQSRMLGMTMLEQTLSKTALANLDLVRKARGIRSRKMALEQILAEAQDQTRVAHLRASAQNAPVVEATTEEAAIIAEVETRGRHR